MRTCNVFLYLSSSSGPLSVTKRQEKAARERDMERARTGLPCFWLVTEGVTVKTTKIVYLLFLKYLLTSTFVVVENF